MLVVTEQHSTLGEHVRTKDWTPLLHQYKQHYATILSDYKPAQIGAPVHKGTVCGFPPFGGDTPLIIFNADPCIFQGFPRSTIKSNRIKSVKQLLTFLRMSYVLFARNFDALKKYARSPFWLPTATDCH